MNQRPAHYPDHERTMTGDSLHGLFMGRVISVDPATYTAKVEVEDGSVTIQTTVMTLRAHDTRGWTWLPEEGELVVVAFLGGAKTRPVILGSMFDSRDGLPNTEEGSVTLAHKSGTTLKIDADGDVHLTHPAGHTVNLDATKVELTHDNGQRLTLSGTQAELTSADQASAVTLTDAKVTLVSNGSSVEVNDAGSINIFPGAGATVSLGSPGSEFAVRGNDVTSPPIGPLASHTHTLIASGSIVLIGG
jgi:phage baseplate assembly protein V